jgi:hypothetical protein
MAFKSHEERKAYYRDYNKLWYKRHKARLIEKSKQHDKELSRWLQKYKSKLCCQMCGERHPACLQFHHRDRASKSYTISHVVGSRRNLSLQKLEQEISKCDILCGNCHALLHWQETHDFDDWREVVPPIKWIQGEK